jgi:hypothetical protein
MIETDKHLEIAKLEERIEHYLKLDSNRLIFEFKEKGNLFQLNLITVNARHSQSFLFHHTLGTDKIDALRKMLDYVEHYRSHESSYTIQWSLKTKDELHTSYFSAPTIGEALDKFHFGRDQNSITIFSIVLNPIS